MADSNDTASLALEALFCQSPSPAQKTSEGPDTEVPQRFPSGTPLSCITASLMLVVFLTGLDSTLLATAIPQITDEFHSVVDVGWYDAAFRIGSSMTQLSQGKLYNNFPVKWLFLANMLLFEIGCLVSATAPSSIIFIIGRAISGVGCAGASQGCMVIISLVTSISQRPKYLGLISSSEFSAIAIGPLLGGAITSNLSWRWCFYINIIGALVPAAMILLWFRIPQHTMEVGSSHSRTIRQRISDIDFVGICVISPAVLCLILGLQWGGTTYPWTDVRVIVVLIICPVLLLVFAYTQVQKQEKAMIPPRIIKENPTLIVGFLFLFFLSSMQAIIQYYVSIWFQVVHDESAWMAGVDLLPLTMGLLAFSIIAGWIVSWLRRYKELQVASAVLCGLGAALLSLLVTGRETWIPGLLLVGVGVGSSIACPFIAAGAVLQASDISVGMALLTFAQDLGESVMIGGAQSLFLDELSTQLDRLGLDAEAIIKLGATTFRENVPSSQVNGIAASYNQALGATLYLATAAAACTIICALLTPHRRLIDS